MSPRSSCRLALTVALFALLALAGGPSASAAAPSAASAQFVGEHIENYDVTMDVAADGGMHVTETIDYDFAALYKHGIYRYIPVRFHFDDKYDRVYPISNIKVAASAGTPTKIDVSDNANNKVIRIGDAKKTITGAHQYTITYDVRGALNHFDDHDELYWNAIGTQWNVPINRTTATTHFPGPVTKVTCFAGPQGSSLPCPGAEVVDGNAARFDAAELGPGSGLTVVAAVAPGVISNVGPVLDERWSFNRAFAVTGATGAVAGSLAALIAFVVGGMLFRHGRDRRLAADGHDERRPLFDKAGGPVAYRPPDELRPAQVGVLIDESADPVDVTASIVDLGVRGYLTIEEIPDKGLFSKTDWKLTKLAGDEAVLQPYEKRLWHALFEGDKQEVLLSELKNHFYGDLKKIQDDLYKDCVKQKWFLRRPDATRTAWFAIGLLLTLAGIGVVAIVAATSHAGFAVLPLILAGLMVLIGHSRMPAKTAAGAKALDGALGFKRFMATAETERMQFAEEEGIFAKYLPYAIVFGITKQWAKRFEGLDAGSPAMSGMGWYVSPYLFNPMGFSNSMNEFTVQTAGTIVSTPPSSSGSSGFGGGGFSGGGGGGGGGGSW